MRIKLYRGWWYAVWRENGRTRRKSLRTRDRGEAERTLHDLQTTPVGKTVGEIMNAYLADLDHRARRPDRQHDAWKALGPKFAMLRPDQITRLGCRSYTKGRRQLGRSDGTIAKELGTLRAALNWHDKHHKAVIELPPSPPPRDRYLTREERDRLIEGAEAFHIRLFIELAIGTGGRQQALLDLTWDRVDFQRGLIDLSKGEARRKGRATVPMTDRLRAGLGQAREVATIDHVIEWGGKPIKSVKRGIAEAARRAGIDDVSPHVFRHTAAVWMAEAGVPIPEISQYLGHSDSRTTERVYSRYSPDYLRRAAGALE